MKALFVGTVVTMFVAPFCPIPTSAKVIIEVAGIVVIAGIWYHNFKKDVN